MDSLTVNSPVVWNVTLNLIRYSGIDKENGSRAQLILKLSCNSVNENFYIETPYLQCNASSDGLPSGVHTLIWDDQLLCSSSHWDYI